MVDGFLTFSPHSGADGFEVTSFELLAEIEPLDFWFLARNELLAWAIGKWLPDPAAMLEVGCGTGFVLGNVGPRVGADRLVGSELFLEGLRVASRRLAGRAELLQHDATDPTPFVDEFDVVGCFDVLEHVADDRAAIRGLRDAVRPDGLVIVTVPQHPRLWSAADDYGHHERRYSRRELHDKFRAEKLDPVYTTSFVSLLVPLMLMSRLLSRRASTGYDPAVEHRRAQRLGSFLAAIMRFERWLIRRGVRFSVGGSLLVVARRAA